MIKIFKASDNTFTSNGDKILKAIDAVITKNVDEEYLEVEAPLEYAEFLIQDNILIVDTPAGKKGYQIHNPYTDDTVHVKALKRYEENIIQPADRGVVISYGKNLEGCKVTENWDDVVTKILPIGYGKATLPEGYLSVATPHQRVYEKSVEFELSEGLKDTVKTLEETIGTLGTEVETLTNSVTIIGYKISACDSAVISLNSEISVIQAKINALGTSPTELKEKAILQAQITALNTEISGINSNKSTYQADLVTAQTNLTTAQNNLTVAQNNLSSTVIGDLRTQAQSYLNANIYPHINYDLSAYLQGTIEIGDTVKVKHERLGIDMLAYITGYQYDCITSKFLKVQFGTSKVSLKSKITGMEQNIKVVSDGVKGASSLIEQLSNQIVLRVDTATGKLALFRLGSDESGSTILLKADNMIFEGLVTANQFFKILADGSMEAVNAKFSGKITGSTININDKFIIDANGKVSSISGDNEVIIENGKIYTIYDEYVKTYFDGESVEIGAAADFGIVPYAYLAGGYLYLSDGYTTGAKLLEMNPISGVFRYSDGISSKEFIHTGNIGEQSVSHADTAGSVPGLSTLDIAPDLTPDGNINFPGTENAAAVNWVQLYYYSKTQADSRYAPSSHSHTYSTSSDLATLETAIHTWVTSNFQPKA